MKYKRENRYRDRLQVGSLVALFSLVVSSRPAQAVTIVNNSNFEMSVTITSDDGEETGLAIPAQSEIALAFGGNLRVHVETLGDLGRWSHTVSAGDLDDVIINARSVSPLPGRSPTPQNLDIQVKQSGADNNAAAQLGTPTGRDVRFLASADPQYANNDAGACLTPGSFCYKHNVVADDTMIAMRAVLNADPGIREIVIAGDLTQDTRAQEFCRYVNHAGGSAVFSDILSPKCLSIVNVGDSPSVYDGLGNHDYNTGFSFHTFMRDEIKAWVKRNRRQPIWILENPALAFIPHYSWNRDDVHFIQLNLFPGNGPVPCSGGDGTDGTCDPYQSLFFLRQDLQANVGADLAKPIIIVHHYGPDAIDELEGWPISEARQYWDLIRTYNVVAILNGHTNRAPGVCSRYDFDQPSATSNRSDGRTSIPAFEVGSAKGDAGSRGAYTYINIHAGHQIEVERREDNGTVRFNWCLPIDSEFYLRSQALNGERGTEAKPFRSLSLANTAIGQFDRNCSLARNPDCTTLSTGAKLPVPTLYVLESRHTEPVRIDAPMTIRKWIPKAPWVHDGDRREKEY